MTDAVNLKEQVDLPTGGVRLGVFLLFLGCGLAFLLAKWLSPTLQLLYWVGFCVLFLIVAFWLSRHARWQRYWEVVFAFFVFTVVIVLNSGLIMEPLLELFNIPETLNGRVLGMLLTTLLVVIPILVLMWLVGRDWPSLYLQKGNLKLGLIIGLGAFLGIWALALLGVASGNYPTDLFYAENLTLERVVPWIPSIIIIVLLNGVREELWFRGLFLKKYEPHLGPKTSNLLQAVIFSLAHINVAYTPELVGFLLITFALGFLWGYLMQKTDSLLAAVLFHAVMDVWIFIGIFSTTF